MHRRLTQAPLGVLAAVLLAAAGALPAQAGTGAVYRWVDGDGVIHISSDRPPAGTKAERIEVGASGGRSSTGSRAGAARDATASPAQVAERETVLDHLRSRECVIALESLDRLTSGTQPVSATELRRLQQTADLNCSRDPVRRREQEDMAAKLRVANGAECMQARNRLAEMLAPGARITREQLKLQQDFVAAHCTAPVR